MGDKQPSFVKMPFMLEFHLTLSFVLFSYPYSFLLPNVVFFFFYLRNTYTVYYFFSDKKDLRLKTYDSRQAQFHVHPL